MESCACCSMYGKNSDRVLMPLVEPDVEGKRASPFKRCSKTISLWAQSGQGEHWQLDLHLISHVQLLQGEQGSPGHVDCGQPVQTTAPVGHGNGKAPWHHCPLPGDSFSPGAHAHWLRVSLRCPHWGSWRDALCQGHEVRGVPSPAGAGAGGGTSLGYPRPLPNGQGQSIDSSQAALRESSLPILLLPPKAKVSVWKTALLLTPWQSCGHGHTPPFPQLLQSDA